MLRGPEVCYTVHHLRLKKHTWFGKMDVTVLRWKGESENLLWWCL